MSEKIKKIMRLIKQFGLVFTLKYCFYKLSKKDDKYIELLCEYLKEYEKDIIEKYRSMPDKENNKLLKDKVPIWVCWFQGEENMPELCKICYERLKKVLPPSAELHLITLDNYSKYVEFPNYIIEKVNNGSISYTHFSDILRWALLDKWGGFWIDSTVYCTQDISEKFLLESEFWSVKLDQVHDINCIGQVISGCQWSGFILKDRSVSLLVKFVLDATLLYWEKHDVIIDYFIENLLLKVAYENIPHIKETIDRIPKSNNKIYDLHLIMDDEYEENKYRDTTQDTTFFKLTWKQKYKKITEDNKETFYGYISKLEGME